MDRATVYHKFNFPLPSFILGQALGLLIPIDGCVPLLLSLFKWEIEILHINTLLAETYKNDCAHFTL